ncbi:ATP-binding protein [Spiroplasma endosymbiont of Seladonia tumulorum]|uniref:ATP-binding protein n=1 Tax=Spiroplasma endosymbiont of Seladonia tumulorum TaxID=3066321 RepID=UPI0030D2552F
METKLLKQNEKYVIGVSGGPDSMFLLDNIYNNSELDINNFIVCLVNYQKRKDSDYDEQIVVEYCQKRNIKVYVKKWQWKTMNSIRLILIIFKQLLVAYDMIFFYKLVKNIVARVF